ncbi:unnamed protein product [Boreogadus saida]
MRRIDDQGWRLSRGRITEQHQGHPGDQAASGVKTGRMVCEEGGSTSPHLEIRSLSRLLLLSIVQLLESITALCYRLVDPTLKSSHDSLADVKAPCSVVI